MPSKGLIVLTGATGFLGFKVLVLALEAGYSVRAVVRNHTKVSKILATPSIKALNPSDEQLSWHAVPDMTVPGSFDEAVKGARYVIHVASPIPSFGGDAPTPEQYEKHFVVAARESTIGLLESARRAGTVERVVITSSTVALLPFPYLIGEGDEKVFNAEGRIPDLVGPFTFEFHAYSASKTAALNASEAWIKAEEPSFDLITIFPAWIFGRDELSTTAKDFETASTNSVLLGILKGGVSDTPYIGGSVLVDDAAGLHVKALNPEVNGNQGFLAVSNGIGGMVFEDGIKAAAARFPHAVADGRLKTTGKQPTAIVNLDAKKSEDTFNFKFKTYNEQVESIVEQYLEVVQ